jgi:transcriptional regulator with XRE-family HTH domain
MHIRKKRITEALEGINKYEEKLAKLLNVSRQAVGERLSKDKEINAIDFVVAVAQLTGRSFTWLAFGDESGANLVSEPPAPYGDCKDQLNRCKDKLIACMEENKRLTSEMQELKNFISDHSRAK